MTQNANGHGPHEDETDSRNVIRMPTLAERDRTRREKDAMERRALAAAEPMINLPPVTKWMLGALIVPFLFTQILLPEDTAGWVVEHFGFIPANIHDGIWTPYTLLSPFTHMLLHGGWMHMLVNGFMLAAFGSGIERWLGGRRLVILFIASGLFGVALHYLLNMDSASPMIGASGGLSGLFAAAIVMLGRGQREMGGKYGMLPFILLWIGVSIGFGMLPGIGGGQIAWAAHVGGFLGGFLVLKAMRV